MHHTRFVSYLRQGVRRVVPRGAREALKSIVHGQHRASEQSGTKRVDFGDLRRLRPISTKWGFDRGIPIDRYYIERFLATHADDIKGSVLEIGDNRYTAQYGNGKVLKSDILDVDSSNQSATIIADLANADNVPSRTFDCMIVAQTLQMVYRPDEAVRHMHRMLKPGGVLLLSTLCVGRCPPWPADRSWGVYWRMSSQAVRRLLCEYFPAESLTVDAHGNLLVAMSFLQGLAAAELTSRELETSDPEYEVVINARAVKEHDAG